MKKPFSQKAPILLALHQHALPENGVDFITENGLDSFTENRGRFVHGKSTPFLLPHFPHYTYFTHFTNFMNQLAATWAQGPWAWAHGPMGPGPWGHGTAWALGPRRVQGTEGFRHRGFKAPRL